MLNQDLNDQFFKKLATMHSIILEISAKKNLSAASENLLNLLLDNLESVSGSIHLYSEDKLFLLSNRGKGCVNDDIQLSNEEEKRLITSNMPVEVKDIFLYPSIFKCVEKGQFTFTLLMPIVSGEYLVGAIFIGKKNNIRGYSKDEKLLLAMICKQVAVVVHNAYLERELLKANNLKTDLYIRSITDPLTGLYHRAHMEFRLREDLKVSKRYSRPFTALMIEIDYFFQISEMNGSQLTYHLLQGVSRTIEKAIRIDVDLPARYSVDTIVVLLPETATKGAMVLAERIRHKINNLHKVINIENFPEISVSIGVAGLEDKDEKVEDILGKLKEALEQAKNTGRNKVFLCQKNPDKQKVFSTFEMTTGMNSELLLASLGTESNKFDDEEFNRNLEAGTAYRTVEYYQKNVSVDWNPDTGSNEIKVKTSSPDEFSYQPMMFLDFIDEEEKEHLKQQQQAAKLPASAVEKASTASTAVNTTALKYSNTKKISSGNKFDNLSVKKAQMQHGKVPLPAKKVPDPTDPQIHSLGFVDEI
jgi:diguanylate cyclase (GGDEF)-like protein